MVVALFGKYVVVLMSRAPSVLEMPVLAEAGLLTAGAAWFLLPEVRSRFRHGKWLM